MRKYIVLLLIVCLHLTVCGQIIEGIDLSGLPQPTQAKALRYWFDDDASTVNTVAVTNGVQTLDVQSLTDGLHTLHYQVIGSDDLACSISSRIFLKMEDRASGSIEARKLLYWFDDESIVQNMDIDGGVHMLDVSGQTDGLHTIYYQVLCSNGLITPAMSSIFLKMNSDNETVTATSFRYWFDEDQTTKETAVTDGVQMLNISTLTVGLHVLYYQIVDNTGEVGVPVSRVFFKDFDKLVESGDNRITKYQYWLNKNSKNIKTVTLDDSSNPYTLISLIPMQKEPIQSDCFQFEITNGVPTVYAKNLFFIRFHDAQGVFYEKYRPFVDYSVKQEISDAPLLESGIRQIVSKPVENGIKWYRLDAEPGDSLQFKLGCAATIQLFAPSGKEVFSASGAESVKWSGLHVSENGTYYLALHDVTATYGSNISIDYNHIDKYAVLRQDVAVVGNGGFSSITFDGNGFSDLYAVDLYTEGGDTIKSSAIRHTSDAIVSVLFDFTDKRTGSYNALFHFTTEDRRYHNMVTVEEAKDIELTLDIKYPGTFLRGTSTTYAITVTNKGNSTAFNVPMEIYLSARDSFANIESVKFRDEFGKEFNKITFNDIDNDSIDNETIDYINEVLYEFNGLQAFIVKNDSIDGSNYGFTDQLITIPPNSSSTFYMEIKSTSIVDLKVRIPSDWITVQSQREIAASRNNRNVFMRDWCCEKEKWECTAEITLNLAGLLPVAGCASGVIDIWFYDIFEIACTDGVDLWDKISKFCFSFSEDIEKHKSYIQRGLGDLIGCVAGKLLAKIGALKNKLRDALKKWMELKKKIKMYDRNIELTEKAKEVARIMGDVEGEADASTEINRLMNMRADCINEVQALDNEIGVLESQIAQKELDYRTFIDNMDKTKNQLLENSECCKLWTKAKTDCPHNPDEKEGKSTPINSMDPNDIFGYTAEDGSHAVKGGLTDVYYTIEFENDPEIATASAHDIYVTDTLDASKFDLSTFAPTRVKIGEKSAELTGDKNFVTTIDMRPEINAIAQVEGTYDEKKGIAKWHISSLDPMTMESTTYVMDGVLPVNTNGQGGGEVMFDVQLKSGLVHGTEIKNRAGIVFDTNEAIMTPYWTNTIDHEAPKSHVTDVKMATDTTAAVRIAATDELSGPWRYDVYVQYGEGSAWWKMAENVPIDKTATVKVYEGINHGFYTIVTDSAGNVEQKTAAREFTLEVFAPQVETNTKIQLAEGWNWMSQNQNVALSAEAVKPKAKRIVSQTEELFKDAKFGWTGDLDELQPTEMYKVQMAEAAEVQLSGLLFNAAFRNIPLREGWNWMGYPVAKTMTVAEAMEKAEAEEGDALIGRDGLATYNEGQWTGTLTEMQAGKGYMYHSVSDKNLFLNASAQSSSRMANVSGSKFHVSCPNGWTVDKHCYPNVMGVVAELHKKGETVDPEEWLVAAFCGDECRGVAQIVNGVLMMNVFGRNGEAITFRALHRESGEIVAISEQEAFRADLLGTMRQPYPLTMGELTGIVDIKHETVSTDNASVYDLQGRKVDADQTTKGVYIVTDRKNSGTQKVVRK